MDSFLVSWKETPAPVKRKRRCSKKEETSNSGKEIHFLRQRILKILWFYLEICILRRSVKNCRYFLNCCESVVRKRTIWTHFSKSEIFTFTVLSFLHRVANKKSNDTFLWKKLEKFDGLINKIFFVIESIMEKNLL